MVEGTQGSLTKLDHQNDFSIFWIDFKIVVEK